MSSNHLQATSTYLISADFQNEPLLQPASQPIPPVDQLDLCISQEAEQADPESKLEPDGESQTAKRQSTYQRSDTSNYRLQNTQPLEDQVVLQLNQVEELTAYAAEVDSQTMLALLLRAVFILSGVCSLLKYTMPGKRCVVQFRNNSTKTGQSIDHFP